MTKAKNGDQRFKKTSYLPYIIAALSVVFVIVGTFLVLASIIRPKNLYPLSQRRYTLSTLDYAETAESLWQTPTKKEDYVIFTPADQTITQGGEICLTLISEQNPAPTMAVLDIDGLWTTNLEMAWNKPYCFAPALDKGFHLVQLQTMITVRWGILVK